MATEQVLSWIQNDLRLSQVVQNFETDFSSGFLLGEVLAHYGLTEANQYTKKKNKESRVNNFYLIEDALRKIKVKFDGKMIHQIMEEERGVALRLLYQIKLAAQRLQKPESDPDELSMTNIKNSTVHKVVAKKQNEVMELSASIVPPTVGGKDVRTNKQKLQDKRIIAFEVNQKKLFDSALEAQKAEMTLVQKIAQEQRSLQQTKLFENQAFMKEWMQEGQQNWQKNQERRAAAIEKVKYFEDREVNIYKNKLNAELDEATNEMSYGILDYMKNLEKLGIQSNISMADAIKRMEEKKGIPPGQIQNFSYAATMNKIKETKKNSDFAGKERDRRRRKMTVDQLNAQTKLDAIASEEQIIAKLIAQTNKEQEESYIEERTVNCKNFVFQQRKVKATILEQQLNANNEVADAQKKLKSKDIEAERKQQNEQRRKDMKAVRQQEKQTARSLYVEIASGLVDLVLDLADETFEVAQKDPQHQIQKPEWRNFLDIFKQGKKVSLRNVTQAAVKKEKDQSQGQFMIGKDTQAHDVIKMFGSDKCVVNLYDYLAGISQFDIGRLRQDVWSQFEHMYANEAEEKLIDKRLQKNSDLSALIESLYTMVGRSQSPELDVVQNNSLFANLNFKLSLTGNAFSGKKTIAKQLVEALGGDVVIFNINDVVKEAIDYINPKKTEEVVVDTKAKGKKPATEVVAVDIFEGKNVQKYKETALAIKEQFLPDDQLPRKVDLAELVLDDQLLTTLLIERMKFQFEGKALGKGLEEIRAGLKREQEILTILEELEQQATQAATDPKAKGAKKEKGGPDPEKLAVELEEIRKFKPVGWILVDYPKTQNQIKLLEQELSGYISKVDQQKPEKFEIQETWQKLVLEEQEIPTEIQPSKPRQAGFDAILFLKPDLAECQRRATGRKIDPNTLVIYLPTELPTDAKTLEKLQDYNDEAGDVKRIKQSAEVYNKRISSMKKWSEQFGLINEEGLCTITLGQEIESNTWNNRESVKEAVMQNIKQILTFKQKGYDAIRETIKIDTSRSAHQQSNSPRLEEQTARSAISQVQLQIVDQQSVSHKSNLHAKTTGPFADKGHERKLSDTVGDGKSSMGGTTSKSAARRKNQPRFEINDTQKINRWEEMLNSYFRDNLTNFTQLTKQRRNIIQLYEDTQTRFVEFICRETSYQKRVNEFVDSFNRFSEGYPDLRSNPETKTELLKRVTILSNQLWEQILERKNQAVSERDNLTTEMLQGWSTHEIAKLISCIASLIQNEFEKLRTTVAITTGWVWNEDIDLVALCSRLDEKAIQTFVKGSYGEPQSPMLDQIISYIQTCVNQLMQEQFVAQNDDKVKSMIRTERINFNYRCNTLRVYALSLLEEINGQTEHVSLAFQNWIITSVKKENTVCQQIVSKIQNLIEGETIFLNAQIIENPRMDRTIERVEVANAIISKGSISGLSQFNPTNRRFETKTLRLLFSEFVKNSSEILLDGQTFITLMMRCYQSHRMPAIFQQKSFKHIFALIEKFAAKPLGNEAESDTFSPDNSSGPQYINWKKTLIFFALFSSTVPNENQLQELQIKLEKFGPLVSQKDFIQTEMWFDDETENALSALEEVVSQMNSETEDATIDYGRLNEIKELIWLTTKRTNENGVRIVEFFDLMRALSAQVQESENSHRTQFNAILDF